MRATRIATAAVAAAVLTLAACSSDDQGNDPAPAVDDQDDAQEAEPAADQDDDPAPDDVPVLEVGETITHTTWEVDEETWVDDVPVTAMAVTLHGMEYVPEEDVFGAAPDGEYLRLELTVENIGDQPDRWDWWGYFTHQSETRAATSPETLGVSTDDPGDTLDTEYRPGQSLTGEIVLDVPERDGWLTYDHGLIGGESFTVDVPQE